MIGGGRIGCVDTKKDELGVLELAEQIGIDDTKLAIDIPGENVISEPATSDEIVEDFFKEKDEEANKEIIGQNHIKEALA